MSKKKKKQKKAADQAASEQAAARAALISAGITPQPARPEASWQTNQGYRIGAIDSGNYDHNPVGLGENSAIRMGGDLANRRQRDNYRNVSLSKRAAHALRDLIVGRGMHCFSDPIHFSLRELYDMRKAADDGSGMHDRIITAIDYGLASDEAFLRWANDPELCDREKKRTYWEMQRIGILEEILVGACIVAHETVDRPRGVNPLTLQMYEQEQIDVSRDTSARSSKSRAHQVINGFAIDEKGRELGCYIYYEHPQESLTGSKFGTQSRFIASSRYTHLFQPIRPNQWTGFTWAHTHGQPLRDRDMFLESEIRYAVKAAMHVLVAYIANGDQVELDFEAGTSDPVPKTSERPKLQNGPLAHVVDPSKGERVELLTPNRPNDKTQSFYDQLDHDVAGGIDISYHTLTGRFGGTTYEGIRGALQSENLSMQPLQDSFGKRFCLKIRGMHQDYAVLNREIQDVTVSQYAKQRNFLRKFDVVAPERIMLNVEKETDGLAARLRGCMTTFKKACMLNGEHWLRVLRQIAIENELFNIWGVVPDWSKGQGGQVQSNNRSRDAESSSESNATDSNEEDA